jgi:hypothetical protein
MAIDERSSLIDVAFAVCTSLDNIGTRAILTGGSAATFYAPTALQPRDCDFITTLGGGDASRHALADLGFIERGGIYSHPRSLFTLEFPPGPLSIGAVLSRTDCVRDRLAGFYFWDDRSSLASALAVAATGPVDWDIVDAWSARETTAAKLEDVRRARAAMGKHGRK